MLRGEPIGGVESPMFSLPVAALVQRALENYVPGSPLPGRRELPRPIAVIVEELGRFDVERLRRDLGEWNRPRWKDKDALHDRVDRLRKLVAVPAAQVVDHRDDSASTRAVRLLHTLAMSSSGSKSTPR